MGFAPGETGRLTMQDPIDEGALSARIERLERRNRRLGRLTGVAAALLAAALLTAQAAPRGGETVEAARFVLKEPSGKVRGEFLAEPGGAVRLNLFREEGGEPAAQIEVEPNGLAHVLIRNGGIAKIGVSAEGVPYFVARDKQGNQLFRAP